MTNDTDDSSTETPPRRVGLGVWLRRLLGFGWRVVRTFSQNKGLLLSGAVGYNALLSVIPLFAIILFILSKFIDKQLLLQIVRTELSLVLPGQAASITSALTSLVDEGVVFGSIGFLVLLFFSSIAFRMLEDAMAVIFRHHHWKESRHPVISALIPFFYITAIGVVFFFLTLFTALLDGFAGQDIVIFRWRYPVEQWIAFTLKGVGFVGMVVLLASFYSIMPLAKVRFKLALVGGAVAALMWEGVRTFLVWYFENISLVNVVYGSLATVIVVLLSMEIAAVIVLLGAQVIAEIEKSALVDKSWWEEPPRPGRRDFTEEVPAGEPTSQRETKREAKRETKISQKITQKIAQKNRKNNK